MRICPNPKCRHENVADVDFCEVCGTYLRWDPTRFVPAIQQPEPEPTPVTPDAETPVEPTSAPTATVTLVLPPPVEKPTYELTASARTEDVPGVDSKLIAVTLRLPDADEDGSTPVTALAEAGGQAVVLVSVRNQSQVVDNYDIDVSGVPRTWWTAAPSTVYLMPFGAQSGESEGEVQIRFHPPRAAEAEARSWPIEVIARSRSDPDLAGSAQATLQIAPFELLESELRPTTATGRRKARYALLVRNRANAPIVATVSAVDADGACTFEFDSSTFPAEPDRRAGTQFTVRPSKQLWIGRPINRRFEVVARAAGGEAAGLPHQAVFKQRPWIPWWVATVAPILLAAAALVLILLPEKTTVPNLVGERPDQAAVLLDDAGLKLSPERPLERVANAPGGTIVRSIPPTGDSVKRGTVVVIQVAKPRVPRLIGKTPEQARLLLQNVGLVLSPGEPKQVVSSRPTGTIIAQMPRFGQRVGTGSEVSIRVAVGSGTRTVPNVVGMTPVAAEKAIRGAGLSMAALQLPPGADPATSKVSTQIPGAGEVVDASEQVTVFVPAPPPADPPTIPAATGLDATQAAAQLAKAGVVATVVRRFAAPKAGTVIGQVPPKGTKLETGQTVKLIVSAGYPEIAYSNGRDLKVMGGFSGKTIKTIAASADLEDEPSWQPNGSLIAYRRGPNYESGRIWLVDSGKPSSARPLTTGSDDRRPAFSPDGAVVAFVRRTTGSDRDLCFARIAAAPTRGTCIADPTVSVQRPVWSPDGSAILVVALQPSSSQSELLEYTSARANSTRPSDWRSQGLVTDSMHGSARGEGVLSAAWAPNGKSVAIAANWGANDQRFFHVFLAPASSGVLSRPQPVVPQIRACSVAWRSDSAALAVMQADDCGGGIGAILRVDPGRSASQVPLRQLRARDPAWQFISLSGR